MSDNPFEAPKSTVSDVQANQEVGSLLDEPRKNPIGFGLKWIKDGFGLFKQSALIWIVITVIFVILNIIPIVSMVASLVFPVLMAGWFYGANELDQGRDLKVGHLFQGFSKNAGSLFGVTGLYLLGIVLSLAIAAGVAIATGSFDSFTRVAAEGGAMAPGQMDVMKGLILPGLIYFAMVIPIAMAVWFAPALVILNDMGAVEAMKHSFRGCLRNMLPYLLFGIVGTILMVLGMIPVLLGLLVVVPMLIAATYTSYKDIFLETFA